MTINTGPSTQTPDEMMRKINEWIAQMQQRAVDLSPILPLMSMDIQKLIWDSRNKRVTPMGVPFPPLSPTTTELYSKGVGMPSTGRLASNFIYQFNTTGLSIINQLPYANTQMYGNPNNKIFGVPGSTNPIPPRPYLDINNETISFPETTLEKWNLLISTYIVEGNIDESG